MAGEPILVVDDNPINLQLATVLLRLEGYDVRTAVGAEEALAALETFHPRLILMDIQLPGIGGLALTQQLKADPRTRAIVILAMTAYAMRGDEERMLRAGCDGYIPKPIDTRRLPEMIREYLQTAAPPLPYGTPELPQRKPEGENGPGQPPANAGERR